MVLCLLLLGCGGAWGAVQPQKVTVESTTFHRKALVAPDCLIDKMIGVVEVGSGTKDLQNLLDGDIGNAATIIGVAAVGAAVDPIVRVKDTKHYYKAGTRAGFCIEAGGGSSVLSLELLKNVSIFFYKDSVKVGSAMIEQTSGGLLNLGLIQIPGQDGVTFLTAQAPADFDEIALMDNGVTVDVAHTYRIRYAFVGDSGETALTTNNFSDMHVELGGNSLNIANKGNIIDADTTNCAAQPVILIDAGANISLYLDIKQWTEGDKETKMFKKGTEVGFVFVDANVLDLAIGTTVSITVTDDQMGLSDQIMLNSQVLGLGLIGGKQSKVSIIAPRDFNRATLRIDGFAVALKGREFYYGFVCPPTDVAHQKDLNTSANAYIGNEVTQYEMFASKPAKWSILSYPEGEQLAGASGVEEGKGLKLEAGEKDSEVVDGVVTGLSCTLTGMTAGVEGEYKIVAEAVDCGCVDTVILTRGNLPQLPEDCRKILTGDTIALSDEIYDKDGSGSLLSMSNMENNERIIDADANNYAEYTGGLSVANNLMLTGVKHKAGKPLKRRGETKRVGFLMETSSEVLDLSLLQFFEIRLYNDKNPKAVYRKVVENTDVVSVGLGGQNRMAKTRYSITAPADVEFDEMQIWKCGVLDLSLSHIRIYSAFISDPSVHCYENPLECGATPLHSGNGAYINYNKTGFAGAVAVGPQLLDLRNVVDEDPDMETYASISLGGLSVGANATVAVKLGRMMDRTKQACVVMQLPTMTAGIDVVKVLEVQLYLEGIYVTKSTDWNIVGVNAVGYGGKNYMFVNATARYDEIRISVTKPVLGVDLGVFRIYGVAVRDDVDMNGIPDCFEGPKALNVFTASDICLGDPLFLTGTGVPNTEYKVKSEGLGIEEKTCTVDENGEILWEFGKANQVVQNAQYTIEKVDPASLGAPTPVVSVHPKLTRWKEDLTTGDGLNPTDWNTWNNWDQGAPWSCTDVIIPTGAATYPILLDQVMNACRYIHFEPEAEVVNTHRLSYKRAWVEIALKPDRYYMATVPLKETFSGDWFITGDRETGEKTMADTMADTFSILTQGNYPANRINPTIYQRVWEKVAYDRLINEGYDLIRPAMSHWTRPANMLGWHYDDRADGAAMSVWIHPFSPLEGKEEKKDTTYLFRFPKAHDRYFYYDEAGQVLSVSERIARDTASIGRFIYERADSTVVFPVKMRVENLDYNNKVYLFANPFMSHIDLKKFLEENRQVLSVKVYSPTDGTTNSLIKVDGEDGKDFVTATRPADGTGNNPDVTAADPFKLAPMQSFFVTVLEDDAETEWCEISFTEEMLCSAPNEENNKLKSASAPVGENAIRLCAETAHGQSYALLRFSDGAQDGYDEREDAEALIDPEARPEVVAFTIAGERALDIQQRKHGGAVPLGFFLGDGAREVSLSLDVPEGYAGWTLDDLETGRRHPLQEGMNRVPLGVLTTNAGRFVLRGTSAVANETVTAVPARIYAYRTADGGTIVVRSAEGQMAQCETFTVGGQRVSMARYDSDEYRLPAVEGVMVVKVTLADGRTETLKLACF